MKKLLIIPLLYFLLGLTFIPPVDRIDGTPFSLSEIEYYTLYCSNTPDTLIPYATTTETYYPSTGLEGLYCGATVTDIDFIESGFSNIIQVASSGAPLKAPTNFRVL